jgi:hypothetical protein
MARQLGALALVEVVAQRGPSSASGRPSLPTVVEQRRLDQRRELRAGQTQPLGQRRRQPRRPLAVARGVGVAHLESC